MEITKHIWLFLIPMMTANILHMVVVKKQLFKFLAVPFAKKLFGKNKTYRGLFALPLIAAVTAGITSVFIPMNISDCFIIGLGLGFVYIVAELPNSFIKRRIGIAEGESSPKYKKLQLLIDKTDSLSGICLFYYLIGMADFQEILIIFIFSLGIHLSLSFLLYKIRMKESI